MQDKEQPQPEPEKDEAEGHEVFVTKDDSGITSLSEEPAGADPTVHGDDGDGATEGSGEGRDSDREGG